MSPGPACLSVPVCDRPVGGMASAQTTEGGVQSSAAGALGLLCSLQMEVWEAYFQFSFST